MKRMRFLALVFIGLVTSVNVAAQSGSCGDSATWSLENSILRIFGTGATTDFGARGSIYETLPEWEDYKDQIKSVVVEEGITSLGSFSFYQYNNLESVSLPEGLIRIGNYAFYKCTVLHNVNIPSTVEAIGDKLLNYNRNGNVFNSCYSLESITLPEGLKVISGESFNNCTNLSVINWNSINCEADVLDPILRYVGIFDHSGVVTVNFGDKVEAIPEKVFWGNTALTYVSTPGTISFVGYNAFKATPWLNDHIVIDDVTYIDKVAYCYTKSDLQTDSVDVVIRPGTTCLTESLFEGLKIMRSVTIPETVTMIGKSAFKDCSGLRTVQWNPVFITDQVDKYSGDDLFIRSTNVSLSEFRFGDKVEAIPDYLLHECDGLTAVTLPASLRIIGERVFEGCNGLTELVIPDGVESLRRLAIYGCANLEKVTIGEGLKEFDYYFFLGGCPKLTTLIWNAIRTKEKTFDIYHGTDVCSAPVEHFIIGDKVEYVPGQLFWGNTTLCDVHFGSSVKLIGEGAFRDCKSLTIVKLPDSLEVIGSYAFYNCRLEFFRLPAGITDVSTWGLGSQYLKTLICCPVTPPSNSSSLIDHSDELRVYVPEKSLYNANGWEQYMPWIESMTTASTHELETPDARPEFVSNIPGYTLTHIDDFEVETESGEHSVNLNATFSSDDDSFNVVIPYSYSYTGTVSIDAVGADISASPSCIIYNLQGEMLYQGSFDRCNLPAGIYVIRTSGKTAKLRLN